MVDGKGQEAWEHTSLIVSVLINVNRAKKDRKIRPDEINPYRRRRPVKQEPLARVGVKFLGGIFGAKPGGKRQE